MFFYYDWTFLILLPALILGLIAQARVNGAYRRYSGVGARCGLTAAETAARMLSGAGAGGVAVQRVPGTLTDHFDMRRGVLSLSEGVYASTSIAALGIAAHEAGHALQHETGYWPNNLRAAVAPVAMFGSHLSMPLFIAGLVFSFGPLVQIGIALFFFAVVFQLVTLPVEFNASARAMEALETGGYLTADELPGARAVLRAAALTYVASALMAIMQLVRLLLLAQGGRRRD